MSGCKEPPLGAWGTDPSLPGNAPLDLLGGGKLPDERKGVEGDREKR